MSQIDQITDAELAELQRRLRVATDALREERRRLLPYTERTHVVGRECNHPACMAVRRIDAALAESGATE